MCVRYVMSNSVSIYTRKGEHTLITHWLAADDPRCALKHEESPVVACDRYILE